MVDETFCLAHSIKRAVGFKAAIAWVFGYAGCLFGEESFVVGGDYVLYIWHAAVANFQVVSIEDLVQGVLFGKAFIYDLQKLMANVGGDVPTVRWIKPNHISVPSAFFFA